MVFVPAIESELKEKILFHLGNNIGGRWKFSV